VNYSGPVKINTGTTLGGTATFGGAVDLGGTTNNATTLIITGTTTLNGAASRLNVGSNTVLSFNSGSILGAGTVNINGGKLTTANLTTNFPSGATNFTGSIVISSSGMLFDDSLSTTKAYISFATNSAANLANNTYPQTGFLIASGGSITIKTTVPSPTVSPLYTISGSVSVEGGDLDTGVTQSTATQFSGTLAIGGGTLNILANKGLTLNNGEIQGASSSTLRGPSSTTAFGFIFNNSGKVFNSSGGFGNGGTAPSRIDFYSGFTRGVDLPENW